MQQPVGAVFGDANVQAPCTETVLSTVAVLRVVALCDNSAQLIVCQCNVVTHVNKTLFGQFLAVKISVFCKMQGRHGLFRQAGIIKLRALVLPNESQGLLLRGTTSH